MVASSGTDSPLGICTIGLGIGRRYLEAARGRHDVRVTSVCAQSEERVREAQRAYDVPFGSTEYRAAVERPDVDLVVVASPDRLHFEHAACALRAGKDVLCEKPMTTDAQDAQRLVDLVQHTGRTFVVGHNYRFIPQLRALHALAARGDLGGLYLGEGSYVQDLWSLSARGAGYWRFSDPQDMFLGAAVHLVDFLAWCLGPIDEVHAYANHRLPFYPRNENHVASLHFRHGAIGHVVVALGSRRREQFVVTFTLHGERGAATADNRRAEVRVDRGEDGAHVPATVAVERGDAIAAQLAHAIDCVRQRREPLAGVREGAAAVAVCVAANRSSAEGRPVRPELPS
ncbi:MAG TPA: Gfo/Idh/MocA family oxidoreductase [Chloroflexota bacterium]|nr:Gfo/Idh/MocA family oxidoreductase [Chloroflexota bacterium]